MRIPSTTSHTVQPAHEAHPIEARFLLTQHPPIVFITVHTTEAAAHEHYFTGLNRFGDAFCQSCGAEAWCPAWVKDGVFGDNTESWVMRQWERFADLEGDNAVALVKDALGGEVIALERPQLVADLGVDMPAKPGRHRRGVPVPAMPYGVLTVQS